MSLEEKIVKIINDNKHLSFFELAKKLNIRRDQNHFLTKKLKQLKKENKIFTTRNDLFFTAKKIKSLTGEVKVNKKGFGFFESENEVFFVPPDNLNHSMNNDLVTVDVFFDETNNSFFASVVKINERKHKFLICKSIKINDNWILQPLDSSIQNRVIIDKQDEDMLSENLIIKVKIIDFGKNLNVKLLKVLGKENEKFIDILAKVEEANVRVEFKNKVLDEAKKLNTQILKDTIRKDFTKNFVVTIDGEGTKDIDDAFELTKTDKNIYILRVDIADVSYYVRENTEIDIEAQKRGTSIYLVNEVIPMLPKILSNGLCSLNPNEKRYAMTLEMQIDEKGNVLSKKVFPSIIESKYQLNYKRVNQFLEEGKKFDDNKLNVLLTNANKLSKILLKKLMENGYSDFEISEPKIILDDQGKVKEVLVKKQGTSEKLIEVFMIKANEMVTKLFDEKKLPFIYRIHKPPTAESIEIFKSALNTLGMEIKLPTRVDVKIFQKAVEKIKDIRFDNLTKNLILRTMEKAFYSEKNYKHFGLGLDFYTHFTSPIRRYPDLLVHRLIWTFLIKKDLSLVNHFKEVIPKIADKSSVCEQKAIILERKVMDMKKAEYLEQFINKELDGIIVGLTKFGIFVEIKEVFCGLVSSKTLKGDAYSLSSDGCSFSNKNNTFKLGQKLKVKVTGILKLEGKINLEIVNDY